MEIEGAAAARGESHHGGADSAGVPHPTGAGTFSALIARPTGPAVAGKRGRSPTDPLEDSGGDTDEIRRVRPSEGSMAMVLFTSSN